MQGTMIQCAVPRGRATGMCMRWQVTIGEKLHLRSLPRAVSAVTMPLGAAAAAAAGCLFSEPCML
jgi:hypothetical protein